MKSRPVFLAFVFVLTSNFALAVDYKVDTSFNLGLAAQDRVNDVHVLADGKILVGGRLCLPEAHARRS